MTPLIQICASQNDLFGLDGEGIVYQYNFNTNSWKKLGHERGQREESRPAGGPTASVPPKSERRFATERRRRPS